MSPAKKPKRPVDVYVRVSQTAGRQGEAFQSPKQQEDRCRAQLAADGLAVGELFVDLDQSGAKSSRPAFDKMMQRVRDGVSGGVIVYDLSRFGRNTRNVLDGVEEIESRGAVFISCNEKLDTSTAAGRFVLTLFAALREMERDQLKERISTSQAAAVARGIHITRHVPPGYRRKPDGRLEPDPTHAPTLRRAFELAASGKSYTTVAAFLTERGFPSGGKAARWQANRISRLLKNRAYLGEARYGSITNPDAHKPLVSLEVWATAQRKPAPAPSRKASALLAGIARCDCCKYALRGSKSPTRVTTYECRSWDRPGDRCERAVGISMKRLDEYVLGEWLDRLELADAAEHAEIDNTAAHLAVADARRAVAEVEELKSTLRPAAYAQALDEALSQLEGAEEALPPMRNFAEVLPEATELFAQTYGEMLAKVEAGASLRDLIDDDQIPLFRQLIGRDIQGVFVSKAVNRNPNLPVRDRVRIVWAGEEMPELPKRGRRFASLGAS